MQAPSDEKISQFKAAFPDRSHHLVEFAIHGEMVGDKIQLTGDNTYTFLMTGPSKMEHKKFTEEMLKARDIKDHSDQVTAFRGALLRAVMAQTRWPDREEVEKIFEAAPEAIDSFQDTLRSHAGTNTEVRSKNL